MSYIVRVNVDNCAYEAELAPGASQVTIGNDPADTIRIAKSGVFPAHVRFYFNLDTWYIQAKERVIFDRMPVSDRPVMAGEIYTIKADVDIPVFIYPRQSDLPHKIFIDKMDEVYIGRDKCNHLTLANKKVSGYHAKIYRVGNVLKVQDLNSKNGTYVNGVLISDSVINNGDAIYIVNYSFILDGRALIVKNTGPDLTVNLDSAVGKIKKILSKYPYFQRSPRFTQLPAPKEFEIIPPPYKNEKPKVNWLSILLSPIIMIFVSIAALVLTDGSITSLIFILPMSLVTIVTSIATYWSQVRQFRHNHKARVETYHQYLQTELDRIRLDYQRQYELALETHPQTRNCLDIVGSMERRLWERTPQENDFLDTRLGTGDVLFHASIKTPFTGIEIEEDPLIKEASRIKEQYRIIRDSVAVLPLFQACTVGFIGENNAIVRLASNMLVQIATHHSYEDVKIVILARERDQYDWQWLRWLPHVWDDGQKQRYIYIDKEACVNGLRVFEAELKDRENRLSGNHDPNEKMLLPYYLFVITDRSLIENQGIMKYLARNNPQLGIGVWFVFRSIPVMPPECRWFIEYRSGVGSLYTKNNSVEKQTFTADDFRDADYEAFARKLAPIREKSLLAKTGLPVSLTFLQGYEIKNSADPGSDFNVLEKWQSAIPYSSLAVPIGVKANGEKYYFDIHQSAHGPHGLVAGTTGSGKSEMLQTWILSMCMHFSPQDVSFVLIDFKGTGLAGTLMNLPHIAGVISNIDKNIQRNLISLESEIERRQLLFQSVSSDSRKIQDIYKYQKAYKEGSLAVPLSSLIIVVDEFAELKKQYPDFMQALISAARVGRTLGIHLVLATQKPSGIIDDQIWSNSKFKWCLKVADAGDSNEMIRRPDAASLTTPGRAYILIGYDESFELVQTFWSGAPCSTQQAGNCAVKTVPLAFVALDGSREAVATSRISNMLAGQIADKDKEEEILLLVRHIGNLVKMNGVARAARLWEPELPKRLFLADLEVTVLLDQTQSLLFPVGLVDNPYKQRQDPLLINLTADGHTVIYGVPGSGKTILLQTIVSSIATRYTPDQVNLYLMDFGSRIMDIFRDLPHVGGIANDNEEEKITNLAKMILAILDERKKKFAIHSVSTLQAYVEATRDNMPYIVILLDNFAPVLSIYPDLDVFFIQASREGGSYGIYFILTVNNPLSLSFRISQNFKQAIALQMNDKIDYVDVVGNTSGMEPVKTPGRGLVRGKPPLEFQTALAVPADGDKQYVEALKAFCLDHQASWTGKRPRPIPVMPTIVTRTHVGREPSGFIPLGLTLANIEPLYFDSNYNFAIISGVAQSGKRHLLRQFARLHEDEADRKLYIVSNNLEPWRAAPWQTADLISSFDAEKITSVVSDVLKEAEQRKRSANRPMSPVILVVDDIASFCATITEETRSNLAAVIRGYKDLNIYAYFAGQAPDVISLYNATDAIVYLLVNAGCSILLGGRFSDHDVFNANIGYADRDAELPAHCGYLLTRGRLTKFKSIYEPQKEPGH